MERMTGDGGGRTMIEEVGRIAGWRWSEECGGAWKSAEGHREGYRWMEEDGQTEADRRIEDGGARRRHGGWERLE